MRVPDGLAAWARLAGPATVLDEVRRRARRGHSTDAGALRVDLTPDRRREVARVLGVRWEASGRPVRLQDLSAALADHGLTLREFVEALDGAVVVEDRLVRSQRDVRRDEERAAAGQELRAAGVGAEDVARWLDDPVLPRPGTGELQSVAHEVALVARRVAARERPIGLAALAAELFGDAHALDHAQLTGRATARLLATVHGLPAPSRGGREWRAAWAAAGVRCDGVSSRVLTLNLPLRGDGAAARWCTATPGEPVWLTLRAVAAASSVPVPRRVFVCENVTVLEAAADELGPACPPMVCSDGIPSHAALDLVATLAAAGCPISVRADVDEAGFVVVDQVRRVAPAAELWRFDLALYRQFATVTDAMGEGDGLPALVAAYTAAGRAVHEEELIDLLLADLSRAVEVPPPS